MIATLLALNALPAAHAVAPRYSYEEAYDNVNGGDWYRDSDNETALLAWGESYVMASLASMFRATEDVTYLDRLVWHADGVLAQRDDARGVTDYRGVSGACWQNTHYQPADEPYCYVVHTGLIATPMVEFAALVFDHGLEDELAWDGATFGDKAAEYIVAAEASVAYHDDQWSAAGYYFFRSDASFMTYPGVDLPFNQSNAMGRLLLALSEVADDPDPYLDKAEALAERFDADLTLDPAGFYLWNYWGGPYAFPGEDISHAAINVDFAVRAAELGVVFTTTDLERFATTFLAPVYITDETISDFVGGSTTDNPSYRPQLGRWLRVSTVRTGVYTAIRNLYEADYPGSSVGSGSILLGWAHLAEFEPVHCAPFFYYVDWDDQGDVREATAYGANVLTTPPNLDEGCIVPVEVDIPRQTSVQQWDGGLYHTVAVWEASTGEIEKFIPYDTRYPHIYWSDGVLYQFADTFVPGDGIVVREHPGLTLPTITSTPPTSGCASLPVDYTATATGDDPMWWSVVGSPTGTRIDPATGALSYTPRQPGTYDFTVRVETGAGMAEQTFDYDVSWCPSPTPASPVRVRAAPIGG